MPGVTARTPAGTMAYTDVGSGPPLVLLHGNPTSARLYRHVLRRLAPEYRCIAPDLIGFGRSEAPSHFSYRPPAHATLVEGLIRRLDLTNITLVLHDWGGPIGLSYALRYPHRVRGLVLMNTWMWPLTHRPRLWAASRLLDTPPGRMSVEHLNAFARLVMPLTLGPDAAPWPAWLDAYVQALDTRTRRHACWALARSLRAETHWLRALWARRTRLRPLPTLLCWGAADPAFGPTSVVQRWTTLLPHTRLHRFPRIGHYLPEELGPSLAPLIRSFLQEIDRSP